MSILSSETTRLLLTGDVMSGRGIDQVLPRPCDPRIHEPFVQSALDYVRLAEAASGTIDKPVPFEYVWGDALAALDHWRPARRLINLETAVTRREQPEPKGINYRMHPANAPVLTAADIDLCVLANNHVLDWGIEGLEETLDTLCEFGVHTAGAGIDRAQASTPAACPIAGGGRILVFAYGAPDSGVPEHWAAGDQRPGLQFLERLDAAGAAGIGRAVREHKRPGDIAIASLHWGGNWGYAVPRRHSEFARLLIDQADIDLVWGHSSHHPRAIDVYHGRLILFGCGDLINDYEGIRGHETYRPDLVLMYLPVLSHDDGRLLELRLLPFRMHRLRLQHASGEETEWLAEMLNREGFPFDTTVEICEDRSMILHWDDNG